MTDHFGLIIDFGYIVASILFILGIKMLARPERARRGNLISALGMLIAVAISMLQTNNFTWIVAGLLIGSAIGVVAARRVQMTAMPQMVAVLNGFGGIASLLVSWENYSSAETIAPFVAVAIFLAVLIGGVTFSGSMVAYAKLSERISGSPIRFSRQKLLNAVLVGALLLGGGVFASHPGAFYG